MSVKRKCPLLVLPLLIGVSLHAQIEIAHLSSKGLSATGFGLFLHAGFPVPQGDEVTAEAGFYYFAPGQYHLAFVPFLAGYRHFLDHSGARWYVEPAIGYNVGGTDIQKSDANGNLLYNSDGSQVDQKISGPVGALGVGYIIPSPTVPLNFGLRFEHVFISGDPSQNIISFRISFSLTAARRMQ
jgi:hypothetical protein